MDQILKHPKEMKIQFDTIEWETVSIGAKQKVFRSPTKQVRLLRLEDDFTEHEWCSSGHIGYVLKGEISIDFDGKLCHYKYGEGIYIESGESNKHKAIIGKGKFAELILIEEI